MIPKKNRFATAIARRLKKVYNTMTNSRPESLTQLSAPPTINIEAAAAHIDTLLLGAPAGTFASVRLHQGPKLAKNFMFEVPRQRAEMIDFIRTHGALPIVTAVTMVPGTFRTADNAMLVNLAWRSYLSMDLDASPSLALANLTATLGNPHLLVASGGRTAEGEAKLHAHWRLDSGDDLGRLQAASRKMAEEFGADLQAVSIVQPMRVAGTIHRKPGQPPRQVTIQSWDAGRGTVSLEYVLTFLGLPLDGHELRTEKGGWADDLPTSAADLAYYAQYMPIADTGPCWRDIGLAFYGASHGTVEGLEAFIAWSRRNPDFDTDAEREECETFWGKQTRAPKSGVGTLRKRNGGASPATPFAVPAARPSGASDVPLPPRTYADFKKEQLRINAIIGAELPPATTVAKSLDEMLADNVYVADADAIASRSSRIVRKRLHAGQELAASLTSYQHEGKTKTEKTIKLWQSHPDRATVDVVTWDPNEPTLCRAPEGSKAGNRAFNTFTPFKLLPPPDDWQQRVPQFLEHVGYLVPIEAERYRFLQWLAHIFQQPGVLPHQAYLMIATTTGIGRGTLASILTRALRGYVAVNASVSALLAPDGFNGQLSQKLLATVDEIREGGSAKRYEQQQTFKSTVTAEYRTINPKFGHQSVERNCCRWLLFSNHLDALPFDNSDRRVVVIENPTERRPADWYERLYRAMGDPAFIASVQHYLVTLPIDDFKPGEIAPMNAAKAKAIDAMEGEPDRIARHFAKTWPRPLATISDLRRWIGEDDAPRTSRAWKHILERAGMVSCGKLKIGAKVETVLIVRGDYTREQIDGAAPSWVRDQIIEARTADTFQA